MKATDQKLTKSYCQSGASTYYHNPAKTGIPSIQKKTEPL